MLSSKRYHYNVANVFFVCDERLCLLPGCDVDITSCLSKRESASKHGCLQLQRREIDFMEVWELREEFMCVPFKDGSAGEVHSYVCSDTELVLRQVSRNW